MQILGLFLHNPVCLHISLQINSEPHGGISVSHPRFVGRDEESDSPLDAETPGEPEADKDDHDDAEAEHDRRLHGQDAQTPGKTRGNSVI